MGKDTTTGREQGDADDRGSRVTAAEKKVAKKKAAKKKTKKKAATARKRTKAGKTTAEAAVAAAPQRPAAPAPKPEPAFALSSAEARSGGSMRGIVALWGPLAIIVLLIVVSRLGDEEPGELGGRAVAGLSSALETAESVAQDVVEDVQDALTGGDPQVAAVLGARATGQGSSGSTGGDLAAAFEDAGVGSAPLGPVSVAPPPKSAANPRVQSDQTTTPASVSGIPGALPPHPENPWAPVDPRVITAMPADPYSQGGGIPAPGTRYGSGGYGAYGGEYPPPGYPPYPPQGYGSAPPRPYAERPPAYAQQQGYGMAPAYGASPTYGAPQGYAYPPQPYGAPAPYPPGYYPPAQ